MEEEEEEEELGSLSSRPDTGRRLFSSSSSSDEEEGLSLLSASATTPTLSLPESGPSGDVIVKPARCDEISRLMGRIAELEAQVAQARVALRERRDVIEAGFRDGLMAREGGPIDELRERPTEELTLRELASVRVGDAVRHVKGEAAAARAGAEEAERLRREAESRARSAEDLRDAASRRETSLRNEIGRLEAEANEMRRVDAARREALSAAREDRAALAVLEAEGSRRESEMEAAREQSSRAASALERAANIEATCGAKVADAEAAARIARSDAAHAAAAAGAEARRADLAELRAERAELDLAERREKVKDLEARLVRVADEYDAKLARKTSDVEAAAKREIDALREQRRDLDRSELEALREARRDAVAALDREADRRRDLERDLDIARKERDDAQARRLATTADLNADAKLANFELATARAALEDVRADLRETKAEASVLREQLDVAEREHAAVLADAAASDRASRSEIDSLRFKVAAYEQLELELDAAVLRCADAATVAAGLSRPERRVKHAVLLAQKLLNTEADCSRLALEKDRAEAQAAAARAALARANARLLDASKPARYLLDALSKRDADVADLRRKLDDARSNAEAAASRAKDAADHSDALQAEVHRLLKHRAELAQLKTLLSHLRSDPAALPPPRPSTTTTTTTTMMPPHQLPPMMTMMMPPNPNPSPMMMMPPNPNPNPSPMMPPPVRPMPPPGAAAAAAMPAAPLASHTTYAAPPAPALPSSSGWHSKQARVGEVC